MHFLFHPMNCHSSAYHPFCDAATRDIIPVTRHSLISIWTSKEEQLLKMKKMLKILSKMGFVNESDVCDSDSEISWSGETVTTNKTKNYFKVNVNNYGDESIFMIEDLKQFSDLHTKISECYPDRNQDDLTIKYLDKNFNFVQIEDDEDFEIFLENHNDQKIYVSWLNKKCVFMGGLINLINVQMDMCLYVSLMALLIFILIAVIAISFVVFSGETAEPVCETRVDHWSEHKKIIREFCEEHPSTEECQHIIVEFLSFMALDSLIEANI
ncbi:uncharacterized protein LOC119083452 [Bradysia coprophila]|uniref:uncharacterized protein LOC119083452 n=1 Tax=Bradysia coprophila TaxID=38358 RepID=UPI00187DCDF1|nr:uncharacterized protein LOC119083452 [Bradysia coprophila]